VPIALSCSLQLPMLLLPTLPLSCCPAAASASNIIIIVIFGGTEYQDDDNDKGEEEYQWIKIEIRRW